MALSNSQNAMEIKETDNVGEEIKKDELKEEKNEEIIEEKKSLKQKQKKWQMHLLKNTTPRVIILV